jgi:3-hydroxyisobutyrate dehydrogenase
VEPEEVGIIGIGLVGTAIARRMLDAKFVVAGFDIDANRITALRSLGGIGLGSAEEVFRRCRHVILSLPDSKHVHEVLHSAATAIQSTHVLIDTTTGSPEDAAQQWQRCTALGAEYGDATILGSSAQVESGEALVIAGGSARFFRILQQLAAPWSRETIHVGICGSAARLKLVVNHVLGLQRLVLAEGLGLARSCGIDLEVALQILRKSPAAAQVMETKGPQMLRGDFVPRARLKQHLKDVTLIEALGQSCNARLPLADLHRTLLEEAVERGWGELDNSAVFKLFSDDDEPTG